jgi:tetratricopeptide (TPR) repeat protein
MAAIFQGRFADAEREMQQARELGAKARDPNVERANVMQRIACLRLQGRYQEMLELRVELSRACQGLELADLLGRLYSSEALLLAGHPARAVASISRADCELILKLADVSLIAPLLRVFEAASDPEQCALVQACLERKECRFSAGGMSLMTWEEPVASLLARCARQARRFDDSQALFQEAIVQAELAGSPPYAAWAQLELAELLLETGPGADLARARQLLLQAADTAERLGMPGLEQRVRQAIARCPSDAVPPTHGDAPSPPAGAPKPALPCLESDGEGWVLSSGDRRIRLKDSRGVRWLHELLKRPGQEVHVLELVAPGHAHDTGDAGELLDAQAVSQFRTRLAELSEELSEAVGFNDLGRSAKLAEEREFLERELSRALGLGGRERRSGAATERARINVQRRLRDVITRIAAQDAALGQRLERDITTGVFCRYRP